MPTIYRSDDASAPSLSGTAGSLITVLDAILVNGYGSKAAAGWAKEFSGTNLAAYRAPAGNRFRLRVDDTATGSARLRGYETMSAISTGTGLFPNFSQISLDSNSILIPKGSGGTARSWMAIASNKALYFLSTPDASDVFFTGYFASTMRLTFFGDLVPYKQGDAFATGLIGSVATGSSSEVFGQTNATLSNPGTFTGHYIARSHLQLGGSIQCFKQLMLPTIWSSSTILGGAVELPVPEPILGELIYVPIDLIEYASGTYKLRRAQLPGAYATPHGGVFSAFDMWTGTGDLAGKTLLCLPAFNSTSAGQFVLDVTAGAW